MGEEDFPKTEKQPLDLDDPLYLSPEELEQLDKFKQEGSMDHLLIVRGIFHDDARYQRYKKAYEENAALLMVGEKESDSEVKQRKYMRSGERRALTAQLMREAHDSDDPNFWQRPEIRERAAELGIDIDASLGKL